MLRVGNFKVEKIYKGNKDSKGNIEVTVSYLVKEWLSPHYYRSKIENTKPLKHQMYHSPSGFNWGYGGSGPADLARSILWDFLGKEPSHRTYQQFKNDYVANFENKWEIDETTIKAWILCSRFKRLID